MNCIPGSARADNLPAGGEWFDGHYYLVVTDEMSWPDAKVHAETLAVAGYAAHLVTLETEAENTFVSDLARAKGIPRASWIGCSDEDVEGEWRWVTGELVSDGYQGWNTDTGEPNNGDGDGDENYAEIGWHTIPSWNDGDGGGPQGFTVEFEWSASSLPAGGEWFEGHYYLVVTDEMSWSGAKEYAETLAVAGYAAHLVTLETELENTFVSGFAREKGIPRASWIGCCDEDVEGEWRWVTGELVSDGYQGWNTGTGEPNNGDGDGNENYAEIGWHTIPSWNDGDGAGPQGFTVEFEPNNAAASGFRITGFRIVGSDVQVSFPSRVGWRYGLQTSRNLMYWSGDGREFDGTGAVMTLVFEDVVDSEKCFYRVMEWRQQ